MLLSNYILNTGVKPYLEYAWVTAPNDAGQTLTNNTITTLTINTEVADTGNNGSISGNQITLAAGTYYYEIGLPILGYIGAYPGDCIYSLYNITSSSYVTKRQAGGVSNSQVIDLKGQVSILSASVFEIRIVTANNCQIGRNYANYSAITLATAGADQRTTIKLWKLA